MTVHSYVVDAESLPSRSSTEVQDKWGTFVREVRAKGRIAVTSRGHADMVIMSRDEYDRVMQALSVPAVSGSADPLADLTRRFDERVAQMNDGGMASKTAKLRAMKGQVPNPPVAGESF